MGQYIEKSNSVIRWAHITANLLILVKIRENDFLGDIFYHLQVLCVSVVGVGVWTIGFKSFISGLLTDRLFLSCAYLQVSILKFIIY